MRPRACRVAGIAALAGLLAGPLAAAPAEQSDTLAARIQKALDREDELEGRVRVRIEGATVVLEGKVPHVWAKNRAVRIALEFDEVEEVASELEIAEPESDRDLAGAVAERILSYPHYSIFDDVNLGVRDGVVTLIGRVTMPYKADEIVERVSRVFGVREVVNRIETLPVSTNDEQIRNALARRIYGDPMFSEYAYRRNPPIHIVVEGGRVVLAGVVRSEVERRRAESIARSTPGVFRVTNRLVVGSP